jgi:hyperosmotically inducible periplasmic protein
MTKLHRMLATSALALPLALAAPAIAADTKADGTHHETQAVDADNTKRNARDADGKTLTPMDQGESEADRTITQTIRKEVVAHDQLSTNAKNVKIITRDGVVTLRGPVKSTEEKAAIASVATKTTGVKRVDNQLEIERNQ